jgi:hypothetical protein
MATDKSEPKVGRIAGIGVLVVTLLIGIRASLITYFDHMTRDEMHRKFGEIVPEALLSLRADEKDRLTGGSMPIQTAMDHMVSQGRAAVSPDIAASASRDTAPLAGWMKMSADVPPAMLAPPPAPPSAVDGGAAPAAVPAAAPDGGSKPLEAAPHHKKHAPKVQP